MTTTHDIRQAVHQAMPTAIENLKQLVSIPSIATQGYPREQVLEAARTTEAQLKAVGFQQVHQLEGLAGGYPAIYGEIPGPPGTPTVLLYAHYDVQPPGRAQEWDSPPFEPTERNGRLYGRGAADDKSGVVAHIATIQAFGGKPPVGIKILIEGDEEFGSSLNTYLPQHPDLFKADIIIIGEPGNWQGAAIPEKEFRRAANVLPYVDLIGNNSLSAQVWAGYAINVIGLDAPAIEGASNSLIDAARARINLRIPPDQSAEHALALLIQHLESVTPWHAKVTISDSHASNGFVATTDGPAYTAARQALKEAYHKDAQITGDGASIPLTNVLSEQFPQAAIIIWGAEDLAARIHGPNESVDLEELERVILTQALFLKRLA